MKAIRFGVSNGAVSAILTAKLKSAGDADFFNGNIHITSFAVNHF